MHIISRTLDLPNPTSQRGRDHNPNVATNLEYVYQHRRSDSFPRAYVLLECLGEKQSRIQRMRSLFVLGSASIEQARLSDAIPYLDEALASAYELGDIAAFAQIAERLAFACYITSSFANAADMYHMALIALVECAEAKNKSGLVHDAPLVEFSLDIYWGLSTQLFLEGDFAATRSTLHATQQLTPLLRAPVRRVASLSWNRALLHQWGQNPLDAYQEIMRTLRMFQEHSFGAPNEVARLHSVAADIAMDVADFFVEGDYHDEALKEAQWHVMDGLAYSSDDDPGYHPSGYDWAGHATALLAYARFQRLVGKTSDRLGTIRRAYRIGVELGDPATQCHALTAFGDEYMARDDASQGLAAYRRALISIAPSDAVVMGARARNMLLSAYHGKPFRPNPVYR